MTEEDRTAGITGDVEHFVGMFSLFHQAMPDENQHVIRQVVKQVQEADTTKTEYLRGSKGLEPVFVFERSRIEVSKRIFHPGSGERISGIDFALSKKRPIGQKGVSVVQVKRNRGRKFYEFEQRDIDQFDRFSQGWRSAYYLMVDETVVPPLDCFLMASELEDLLGLRVSFL